MTAAPADRVRSGVAQGGSLCGRIRQAAAALRTALRAGPTADQVDAILARLDEPSLRIAVGGRLKAGKSTLINALVGQRVTATAATEATVLVAWFRGAHQNRVLVRCTDGREVLVPGRPGGGVPDDVNALGIPREEIAELVVDVVSDRLAGYTIVDTPGIDSLTGLDRLALGALARADALLYVMPHPGPADVKAIEELRSHASTGITAANVVGVLSRVDELGLGTDDPWPIARRIADVRSERLRGLVATTIPIAGLIAETALGDRFTENDTRLVVRLAEVARDDPASLADALYSVESFRAWRAAPIPAAARERLLGLLGWYGIREAVASAPANRINTRALLDTLRQRSGIDALTAAMTERFLESADRLRATTALAALIDLARVEAPIGRERDAWDTLHTTLSYIRRHPQMRQAGLNPALVDLATQRLDLRDADVDALLALAGGNTPAACLGLGPDATPANIAAAADAQARRWRTLESRPPARSQRHARAARELCEALFFGTERMSR